MRTFHGFSLLALALLAGFTGQGCAQTLPDAEFIQGEEVVVLPPPLVEVVSPRAGAVYTDVDDVDPAPGLQILVVVKVNDRENDVSLDAVSANVTNGPLVTLTVDEWNDGREARGVLTLGAPGTSRDLSVRVSGKTDDTRPFHVDTRVTVRADVPPLCSNMLTLGGDLVVQDAADLAALSGESCVAISGDLVVEDSALDALSGLEPIVHVTGTVRIAENTALASIDALSQVRFVGGDLVVTANPALPREAIDALVSAIGDDAIGGAIVVGE